MKKVLALRLKVNGGKSVVGGAVDLSVLSAAVTLVGALGPRTNVKNRGKPDIDVWLGGLTSRPDEEPDEHLDWLKRKKLKVGDRVLIEVVETLKPGRVVRRKSAGTKSAPSSERGFYERTKKLYFELKNKYEPES